MTINRRFIGGPCDGQVHAVEEGARFWVLPIPAQPPTFAMDHSYECKPASIKTVTYEARQYRFSDWHSWQQNGVAFVHESVSLDAFNRILDQWRSGEKMATAG